MDVNTYYLQLITEYFLAVEIDEQSHEGRTLIFEKWHQKKKNRHQKKTNDAGRGYDADYEVSKIQIFISKYKDEKIKELKDYIKLYLTNQTAQ